MSGKASISSISSSKKKVEEIKPPASKGLLAFFSSKSKPTIERDTPSTETEDNATSPTSDSTEASCKDAITIIDASPIDAPQLNLKNEEDGNNNIEKSKVFPLFSVPPKLKTSSTPATLINLTSPSTDIEEESKTPLPKATEDCVVVRISGDEIKTFQNEKDFITPFSQEKSSDLLTARPDTQEETTDSTEPITVEVCSIWIVLFDKSNFCFCLL
jgi:hypothetical protein